MSQSTASSVSSLFIFITQVGLFLGSVCVDMLRPSFRLHILGSGGISSSVEQLLSFILLGLHLEYLVCSSGSGSSMVFNIWGLSCSSITGVSGSSMTGVSGDILLNSSSQSSFASLVLLGVLVGMSRFSYDCCSLFKSLIIWLIFANAYCLSTIIFLSL